MVGIIDTSTIVLGGISAGTALSLLIYVIKASAEFGALKAKVDTMWAFQMRRAISEVSEKGLGTLNSPLKFDKIAYDSLAPIKDELIQFYKEYERDKDDAAVLLAIETKFGERLLRLVCIPCMLTHGACLILALAVAKQSQILNIVV